MELALSSPAKKWTAAVALLVAGTAYTFVAARVFVGSLFSKSSNLATLERAARFDSGSAEYQNAVGVFQMVQQSPGQALPWLESATSLNPNGAKYWLNLAVDQQLIGNTDAEQKAIAYALAVDPHTPQIAWQAANLLLAMGNTDAAMKQFHTVLENDPALLSPAIATAWKIRPDADFLLQNVVPDQADPAFLEFLLSVKETDAAAKVWQKLFTVQQPVERRELLDYVRYLLLHQDVAQASLVWQQGAAISDLAPYQSSAENLLVNGDFSLAILNGGFDWVHQNVQGVTLALDPTETHSSSRSLRISVDGAAISDAGIAQRVPVEPNRTYEFSAFYKAQDMDGAGSMQFAIHDAYTGATLFTGDDLKNADFWKKTGGIFTTSADTHLILVHVTRTPAGLPVRGTLWIDGLQLVEKGKDAE